jgi:putative transposase
MRRSRGRGNRQPGGAGRGGGRRPHILTVELANRESGRAGTTFSLASKTRGLAGVEFGVSDDNHAGLKVAIREVMPEAAWQRCYVHFLRNALDHVLRKVDDDCLRSCVGSWLASKRLF